MSIDKDEVKRLTRIEDVIASHVKLERRNDTLVGLCPFHTEDSGSFTVYTGAKDPHAHCYGCNWHGDVFAFLMQIEGKSFVDVLKELAARAGVVDTYKPPTVKGVTSLHETGGLSLEKLANAKKLPVDFLQGLGLRDTRRNGVTAVTMPYPNEDGDTVGIRYRLSLKTDPRFIWRRGDHTILYGLDRLKAIRQAGSVILYEGESDCWTSWHYNLPALGIPGKSTWKSAWASKLEGVTVYPWVEPSADDLLEKVAKDIPNLHVIYAPEGVKDISQAHINGIDVPRWIEGLRAAARPAHDILQADNGALASELRQRAAEVLASLDPVEDVEDAIRGMGYGGDIGAVMLTYLAATSRLLLMRQGALPVHTLLVGSASSGKTHGLKTVQRLLPDEAHYTIDAGSPSVLIYDDADLQHRMLVFSEADSLPAGEDSPAASAVRNLLQDHHLHYKVTVRDQETGDFAVREVSKPGPTVLVTTSTRKLGHQLDTRLFSVEVADDQTQIRAALTAQALLEIEGGTEAPDALIAYQALLQTSVPWDVVVPFARKLALEVGKSPAAPRILRDFARLISLVKAVTVLRHVHRERGTNGRLIATLDDYRTGFELVKEVYAGSASGGASKKVREAVQAVRELRAGGTDPVTVKAVADHLEGVNKMAASRRVTTAEQGGWLVNKNAEKGKPKNVKDLDIGEPLPAETGLPTPEMLADDEPCNSVTPLTVRDTEDSVYWPAEVDTQHPVYDAVKHVTPLHTSSNGNGHHETDEALAEDWLAKSANNTLFKKQ